METQPIKNRNRTTGTGKAEDKDYDPHRKMIRAVMGPKALAQQ
jgi:hypothetical protein